MYEKRSNVILLHNFDNLKFVVVIVGKQHRETN